MCNSWRRSPPVSSRPASSRSRAEATAEAEARARQLAELNARWACACLAGSLSLLLAPDSSLLSSPRLAGCLRPCG